MFLTLPKQGLWEREPGYCRDLGVCYTFYRFSVACSCSPLSPPPPRAATKKQRLAASFTPEAIQSQLQQRRQAQEELNSALASLQAIDFLSVFRRKLIIDEQQALLLLSCKLTFDSVILLKMALHHVPLSFSDAAQSSLRVNFHSMTPYGS